MSSHHTLAKRALGSLPFRLTARAIMQLGYLIGRLCSFVRTRALFPDTTDVVCHWSTEVKCPENVTLGKRVVIGTGCTIGAGAPIYIGDDVLLSEGAMIETGGADISTPLPYQKTSSAIRIERGVWIGTRAIILAGVTVGENSVIAAGAVVRKSVPPNSFVVPERVRVQQFQAGPSK